MDRLHFLLSNKGFAFTLTATSYPILKPATLIARCELTTTEGSMTCSRRFQWPIHDRA
jgi:hypothetical protein